MRYEVVDFRNFYDTRLGRVARHYVLRSIRDVWPNVKGQEILGFGYTIPFLQQFLYEADRVISVMPSLRGAHGWPERKEPNRVILAEDKQLPFVDESIDKILVVHGLEHSEHVKNFLREVWRVVRPSGKVLIVVPNRRGLWAQTERTPFGHGRPYATEQLSALLQENLFTPISIRDCLYTPPLRSRWLLGAAPGFESLGGRGLRVGGVLVSESVKQIYAIPPLHPSLARKAATRIISSAD